MKRAGKIALWVVGSLVAIVVALFMSADIVASRLVQKKVRQAFEQIPDAEATVGGIYLNLLSGSAIVKDITFSTNSLTLEDSITARRAPGLALHIPTLAVITVHYADLWREHALKIHKVSLDHPEIVLYIDEKHPESILPAFPKDSTLEKAGTWLKRVGVHHFEIEDLQARVQSTISPMHVALDSLTTEWHNIRYDFEDSVFSFNDSVYEVELNSLRAQLPDGLFGLEFHDLKTEDQGPIELGYTRFYNTLKPSQLAELKREPVSWIDIELNHLRTSALNPLRKVQAKDYTLESLQVDARRIHVCRDTRYGPKHPFGTPQAFLMALPVRFAVKQVNASVQKMDLEVRTTPKNHGAFHIRNARAQLSNVTNRPGATWYNLAKAPFGDQGHVEARYMMHMDKKSSFEVQIEGSELEIKDMNGFLRPLIGVTCECTIHQLDAHYQGDKNISKGHFCMQYHGMNVTIHKEDPIPYDILAKNADFFSGAANALIPKSNPTAVDIVPRKYQVEWKRDEWKPYPLYLFGPCIDGVKMTMLPGLFVHKQIMN